jgi:Zn-dependent protease
MVDFRALASSAEGWMVLLGIFTLILVTNAFHEGGHAWAAWVSGDRRTDIRRRVTLNPIKHFHWILSLVLPAVSVYFLGWVLGGAKPVLIDAGRIGPRRMAFVGLAGPVGNFLFCGLVIAVLGAALAFDWINSANAIASPLWKIGKPALWFSAALGLFNLLPFPPLDGSRIVGAVLPDRIRGIWYRLAPLGIIGVLAFSLWLGGFLAQYGLGRGHPEVYTGLDAKIDGYITAMSDFWRSLR